MKIKEAKEIIRAGVAWANWTEEQKQAMEIAYKSLSDVEEIKSHCINCDGDERSVQPHEILDIINR